MTDLITKKFGLKEQMYTHVEFHVPQISFWVTDWFILSSSLAVTQFFKLELKS